MMQILQHIALEADASAARYVKAEIVEVSFATVEGELISREGPNRYQIGDALICGSTGDRWSVSAARFDAKYAAILPTLPGRDGQYRARPVPVIAKQMAEPFALSRSEGGDILHGAAGDWMIQYSPGDFGIVEQQRFARVYRRFDGR